MSNSKKTPDQLGAHRREFLEWIEDGWMHRWMHGWIKDNENENDSSFPKVSHYLDVQTHMGTPPIIWGSAKYVRDNKLKRLSCSFKNRGQTK